LAYTAIVCQLFFAVSSKMFMFFTYLCRDLKNTVSSMKNSLKPFLFVLAISLASCKGGKTEPAAASEDTLAVTIDSVAVPDSTLYGTSLEFGMSTFSMATDQGDTLYVTRTASDGTDGTVYGSLEEGKRYAMVTCDGGEAFKVVINLSQLETFTKDYEVRNGLLVLLDNGVADTVEVETLTDNLFIAKGAHGKVYTMKR